MQWSLPVGRQRSANGVTEKNNGGGGLSIGADGQAASAQIAEIQWAVGSPLVKPSADLWGFVRWATSNPLTTAAAARGSSVDSQTISGGPPLTRTSFISSIDYNVFMVLQCHLKDHLCRKVT